MAYSIQSIQKVQFKWSHITQECLLHQDRAVIYKQLSISSQACQTGIPFHNYMVCSVSAVWKKQKLFLPHPRVKVSIVGSLRDREVACSASDRQGSNFESCVWRTVSSQSSHHPQEVLLAQFSLYVHKGGLKPDSFHLFLYGMLNIESKANFHRVYPAWFCPYLFIFFCSFPLHMQSRLKIISSYAIKPLCDYERPNCFCYTRWW